jgi:hypothetical protein
MILDALNNELNLSYEEIEDIGREEIKNNRPLDDIYQRLANLEAHISTTTGQTTDSETMCGSTQGRGIEFKNRVAGDEIMTALAEIEKLDPSELEFFRSIILNRLDHLRGTDHSR